MRHLDLFSGIGGFSLAAFRVFKEEYENVGFCEINKYCQELLKLRFKGAKIYEDIKGLKLEKGCADIITGGFPCQPFSIAGKRRGTEDDRHLWPEMLRVIREVGPAWVIGENVGGLLTQQGGVVFGQVLTGLEGEGYEVLPFVIPACGVNAPHRRYRVWIIAHSRQQYGEGGEERREHEKQDRQGHAVEPERPVDSNIAEAVTDTRHEGLEGWGEEELGHAGQCGGDGGAEGAGWGEDWYEVATRLCGVDDGLPCGLDGFKLSKSQHRVERLKGLGNAIVPQVAMEIFKAIKYAEARNENNKQ